MTETGRYGSQRPGYLPPLRVGRLPENRHGKHESMENARAGADGAEHPLVTAARVAGVADARVLAAVRDLPRTRFVPAAHASVADRDEPVPIGHQQVTTQPSLSARMLAGLHLTGDEHVLEVGTGYGYQTGLLAKLAARVTSVEWWPDLAAQARANLAAAGCDHVQVVQGDGSLGYPASAPYDAVVVSAAYPAVPDPLVAQLRPGGRLVQPIGSGGGEQVVSFVRASIGLIEQERLTLARFVRLVGRRGFPEP